MNALFANRRQGLERNPLANAALVLLAGALYAVALKYFVLPAKVVLTGTEGVAAALSYYYESESLFVALYLAFQGCILTFGYKKVSRGFALRSLLVVATVALGVAFLPELEVADPDPSDERIMLVLFGGMLAGVAKALAFRNRGSTGDEDVVAAYFASKYLKPVGVFFVVVATISTAFGLGLELLKTGDLEAVVNTLMYTALYIFISSEALNNLYHRFKLTILTVFTSDPEAMGKAVCSDSAHRTFTIEEGHGGFSGLPVRKIRTILTMEELPGALAKVEATDPNAFYFYHDVEGISRRYYIPPIG